MISRREFTVSLTAAGLLSGCIRARSFESADVIVIGAGLSGLNTALILSEFGLNPIVLEAGTRVGGRMQTIATTDGPLDVGASQIGRGYARTISLCQKLNLKLIPEDRDLLDFGMHYNGNWIDPKTWADNPLNKCEGAERAVPPMMMGRWITSKYNPVKDLTQWLDPKLSNLDISLRDLMIQNDHSVQAIDLAAHSAPGIGVDETSMLRMWQEEHRGQWERNLIKTTEPDNKGNPFGEANDHVLYNGLASISNIEGGCQRLPEEMAGILGDAVRLNKHVSRIEMNRTSATVTCLDGTTFKAPRIVSALPFSMLRDVEIIADAAPVQQQAIKEMPYANTARLYMTIDKPFWEEDGLSPSFTTDGPLGMFWAIDNTRRGGPHRAMIVLVGKKGEAISKVDNPQEYLVKELERLRPASKGLINTVAYKDWLKDPLQKGCGFSLAPNQVNEFGRDMIKPWGVMHFAGEHTRRAEFGMESALESSERVSSEILDLV